MKEKAGTFSRQKQGRDGIPFLDGVNSPSSCLGTGVRLPDLATLTDEVRLRVKGFPQAPQHMVYRLE